MQTSHNLADGSADFYNMPHQELESYILAPAQNLLDHHNSCFDDGSEDVYLSVRTFEQYCNVESSSGTGGGCRTNNSSSTTSFSSNGSPVSQSYRSEPQHSPSGSPVSRSCMKENQNDLQHKLRELETAMLGPDPDTFNNSNNKTFSGPSQVPSEADKSKYLMEMIARGDLKAALCACANAIAVNDMLTTEWLITELRQMVSVSGDPVQRLGAYMLEALIARLASSGSSIYKALRCKEPAGNELLSYMHMLFEVCPYFKFGYMSANGAIAEAMKDESKVHIIDFQIAQGSQWVTLIQAVAARPGGPPHIRITGIDDSTSVYARGGGLEIVGKRLSKLAESCKVPFEFHAVGVPVTDIKLQNLEIRPGEAIAANLAVMLHHLPDESVSTYNHRDRLLRLIKSLSPKVVALVEQEANTNTSLFYPRFVEAFNHYMAIFDSIDATLPRDHKERINVEQHCLAREVVNIVACEGAERVERHELLGKWRSRFQMAGFSPLPLSSYVNATIKQLLESYNDKYTLEEKDGALCLGWKNQNIVTSCAWR
ncbi:hypothetical protein ACFE04_024005 [Oxalis oulophora]